MNKPKPLQLKDLKVDYMNILGTQSRTGDCDRMVHAALRQIENIKGVSWNFDSYGNFYVTKGKSDTYPAFVCHLDTVHPIKEKFTAHEHPDGFFYATATDGDELVQVGIGGDDKCGILLCIELLHRLKAVKCAFFLDEETGCKGSSAGRMSFFDDCRFAVQIDRKGGGDIIYSGSGTELCSTEFKNLLEEVGKAYDYKPCMGASTDVVKLKDRGLKISAVNLSAGYYNPHSKAEYINVAELLNCLQFCIAISMFKNVFEHVPVKKSYTAGNFTTASNYGGRGGALTQTSLNKNTKFPAVLRNKGKVHECVECGGDLTMTEYEQRLHTECLEGIMYAAMGIQKKFLPQLDPHITLEIDDDGTACLNVPDVAEIPELPLNFVDKLPSEICLLCETELGVTSEKQRGFCEACLFCSCGTKIESRTELLAKECWKCLSARNVDFCAATGCIRELTTASDKKDGYCMECAREMSLVDSYSYVQD